MSGKFLSAENCFNKKEFRFPKTLKDWLNFYCPDVLKAWDGWDFKVISTGNNLDDDMAQFIIYLKNKNGKYQQVTFYL